MKYHVYIQGYGEDDAVNDYDEPVAAFENEGQAIWFATHFPFKAPALTPRAKVIVEERDGDGEFADVILEIELEEKK